MTRIGVLTQPLSKSSMVMARFDEAGYKLGDVDRRTCERYPAGRLELWPLAKWTHSGDKVTPRKAGWPRLSLGGVQVVKCLPAWYLCLAPHITYWLGLERGPLNVSDFTVDEVLNVGNDFDPHDIWARACGRTRTN